MFHNYRYSVKLHLRDERTKKRTTDGDASVPPSLCPLILSVRGVHPMGGTNRDAS